MEQYEEQINQEYMNPTAGLSEFHMNIPTTSDIYPADHRQQYHVSFSDHDALVLPVTLTNQLHQDLPSGHLDSAAGEDSGSGIRWPRQETQTLLEIRSTLDSKFKQSSNQKAPLPLWDQVSRIMATEHGYCRTGKNCKEKFENLYKYYKKTKYGKVGKQQRYRFFGQLESLNYGLETRKLPSDKYNLALFNSFCFDEDKLDKMKSLIDVQMRKLMEKQEEWLEKVLKIIERKEQERVLKEEEWRMQEVARVEKECELWAKERAWMESRDVAIMEAFGKLAQGRQTNKEISRFIGEEEVENIMKKKNKENPREQVFNLVDHTSEVFFQSGRFAI